MTRQEAIEILQSGAGIWPMTDRANNALNKAIKALEQEPVLDKIRAEIEAKCCITVGRENDGAITLHDVFEIIDKYKAEDEPQESEVQR